jgi:hypothetical protein
VCLDSCHSCKGPKVSLTQYVVSVSIRRRLYIRARRNLSFQAATRSCGGAPDWKYFFEKVGSLTRRMYKHGVQQQQPPLPYHHHHQDGVCGMCAIQSVTEIDGLSHARLSDLEGAMLAYLRTTVKRSICQKIAFAANIRFCTIQ